jgi:hypothetical protein
MFHGISAEPHVEGPVTELPRLALHEDRNNAAPGVVLLIRRYICDVVRHLKQWNAAALKNA